VSSLGPPLLDRAGRGAFSLREQQKSPDESGLQFAYEGNNDPTPAGSDNHDALFRLFRHRVFW
jgi:hypothetical protein